MIRAIQICIYLALGTLAVIAATDDDQGLCTTDSNCALLCPADDDACDGGPGDAS